MKLCWSACARGEEGTGERGGGEKLEAWRVHPSFVHGWEAVGQRVTPILIACLRFMSRVRTLYMNSCRFWAA